MGNSTERVPIKDLNDVIYYRQIKQYSDAEYEASKDLKKEKAKGRIVVLEQAEGLRGSDMDQVQYLRERVSSPIINAEDLKLVLRGILPEITNKTAPDIKSAVREIAPLIVEMVRQELSRFNFSSYNAPIKDDSPAQFQGPEYIPTVSTEGLISNVEAKKTEVSSDAAQDALAALRRLNSIKNP